VRTSLLPVPLVPEISLHLAEHGKTLFGDQFSTDTAPPFWAFAWAGGQALARYVLDHPESVAGRRVIDIATGSGVAAVAAARAGAASVAAIDRDPAAVDATLRNAAANGVTIDARTADIADVDGAEVILAGDVFYMRSVADRMTVELRRLARTGLVLVGDPGRGYFPGRLFRHAAEYVVPVPAALEDTETLVTAVWEMLSPHNKLYAASI
jgi:predicted nicotinamide N-methyase